MDINAKIDSMKPNDIRETDDLDEFMRNMTNSIVNICENNRKNKSSFARGGNVRTVPWWNSDLTLQRKRVRALRRRYQRYQLNEDIRNQLKINYKRELAKYKLNLLKAKSECWKDFCSAVNIRRPFGPHTDVAFGMSRTALSLAAVQKPDGSFTDSTENTIAELLNFHFPQDCENEDTDFHRSTRITSTTEPDTDDDKDFTIAEVEAVLGSIKTGKAPGPDGLSIEIIREIFHANRPGFLAYLNECLKRGIFPKCWKRAKLILFQKKGKPNHDPSAYRPICLLSIWSKVLDKLLTNRLYHFLLTKNLLNNAQYGFIPGRGTTQAIDDLVNTIRTNKGQGLHTIAISLDVKGAFNNVWWPHILRKLIDFQCPKNLFRLVSSFLADRSVYLEHGGVSVLHNYFKGCPQGSNSGPLLWNIAADEALCIPREEGVKLIAYADDLLILVAATGRRTIESKAETMLNKLDDWIKNSKMSFCKQKTKMVVFPKTSTMKRLPTIHFQGTSIKAEKNMTYLGVVIDSNLTWIPHLEMVKKRCTNITNKLNGMSARTWGLSGSVKKAIYKRGIERIITYACGAWWTAGATVKMRDKIQQAQRSSLLTITRCYRTVSTAALQVLAGVQPVDLVVDREACLYRIQHHGSTFEMWNSFYQSNQVEFPLPFIPNHPATNVTFKWNNDSPRSSGVEIFTDGSKNDEHVGAAFCVLEDGTLVLYEDYKLPGYASIFQAEVTAIAKSLDWININATDIVSINIYTDSQAALNAISNANNKFAEIINIRNRLEELTSRCELNFHWVPGHTGIMGNELADSFAKKATTHGKVDLKVKIPLSFIKSKLHNSATDQWNDRWMSNTNKGRHTAKIFPRVSTRRINGNFYRNQLLSNHGTFPHYFSRFNIKFIQCRCEKVHNDVVDLMINCDQIKSNCAHLLPDNLDDSTVYNILANPSYAKNMSSIVKFIMDNENNLFRTMTLMAHL